MARFHGISKARTHCACSVSLLTILSIFSRSCRLLSQNAPWNIHFAYPLQLLPTIPAAAVSDISSFSHTPSCLASPSVYLAIKVSVNFPVTSDFLRRRIPANFQRNRKPAITPNAFAVTDREIRFGWNNVDRFPRASNPSFPRGKNEKIPQRVTKLLFLIDWFIFVPWVYFARKMSANFTIIPRLGIYARF